jgi:hypothetical protein
MAEKRIPAKGVAYHNYDCPENMGVEANIL